MSSWGNVSSCSLFRLLIASCILFARPISSIDSYDMARSSNSFMVKFCLPRERFVSSSVIVRLACSMFNFSIAPLCATQRYKNLMPTIFLPCFINSYPKFLPFFDSRKSISLFAAGSDCISFRTYALSASLKFDIG